GGANRSAAGVEARAGRQGDGRSLGGLAGRSRPGRNPCGGRAEPGRDRGGSSLMGPWSRSFLAAVAGNAERPSLEVTDLKIEPGVSSARVEGCEVSLSAAPIPQRVWSAVRRYADGIQQLEDALEGRVQSVHLEHLLQEDW